VSTIRVTATPDTSGWPDNDIAWDAGICGGVWQEFTGPDEAQEFAAIISAFPGWSVELKHLEEA
jgi:hypothetical protein